MFPAAFLFFSTQLEIMKNYPGLYNMARYEDVNDDRNKCKTVL